MHVTEFLKIPHVKDDEPRPETGYFTWTPDIMVPKQFLVPCIPGIEGEIPFYKLINDEKVEFSAEYQNEKAKDYPCFLGYVFIKENGIFNLKTVAIER